MSLKELLAKPLKDNQVGGIYRSTPWFPSPPEGEPVTFANIELKMDQIKAMMQRLGEAPDFEVISYEELKRREAAK